VDDLRTACAAVARRASWVRVQDEAVADYAAGLRLHEATGAEGDDDALRLTEREHVTAFWLQLDAINFGSGWFPTLRRLPGHSGYRTIAGGWRARAEAQGPFTAAQLRRIDAGAVAAVIDQDPRHPLVGLFAGSLRDLGDRVQSGYGGSFSAVVDAAAGSAVRLARRLGGWDCFADCSRYQELELPFLKRAQIAAADLHRAGVGAFGDRDRLTMFADNLVPHVLRLDGVLRFDPRLVARIEQGQLIEHDSSEEIEIRACAVHAVELIVGARGGTCAADVDQLLWRRGQQASYKAVPRHRSRCRAY
jgi:Potential Queuosine, Q, salvage protein family